MRNFLLGIMTAVFLPILLAVALFLFLPKLEAWRDAYASIPAFVVSYALVYAAQDGDFERAAATLDRQANLAERLGMNDRMRRNLVENTRYVMDRARYREHFIAMRPWLDRLIVIAKHNYLAKLMAAEAVGYIEPARAEQEMSPIRDAAPSFDRAYRPVIEADLKTADGHVTTAWCRQFAVDQSAAFGMYEFRQTTFEGQNVGAFFLAIRNPLGKLTLQPHEGFKLNERRIYTFEFGSIPAQEHIRLHLPSLPGVKIVNHGLIFKGPHGERRYEPRDLKIASRHGFFLDAKSSIVTSFRGDILTYAAKKANFPESATIMFDLEFERLSLSNHQACLY